MKREKKAKYTLLHCIYTKNKHNYMSGCGRRAGLNVRGWNYCPFCGRPLSKIWNVRDDNEEVAD